MPYSKAHYFLVALLIFTFMGFWDSYFGKLSNAPIAHHMHGITSTLWLLLIGAQNWLIHSQRRELHKLLGKSLFILVPLMSGSFAMVTWVGAQKAVGGHPFYEQFGQALLVVDVLLLFIVSLHVYLALKFRRNVRLHSALMLGTVIGLIGPIFARLFVNWIPSLNITSIETMSNFSYGINYAIALSLLIPLILYIFYRRDGWPWVFAVGSVLLIYSLYFTLGQTDIWANVVQVISTVHPVIVFGFGFIIGSLACVLGWKHGGSKVS